MTLLILLLLYSSVLSYALSRNGFSSESSGRTPGSAEATGIRPARVLVVGATGGTGRELVKQALERGYTVTALARNPAAVAITHERLSVVQGDVMDPVSLLPAVRGQDAVLCALGHKKYFSLSRILSKGTQNILQAMESEGVRRLVCETSLGIGDSAGRMGLYYTFFVIPVILPLYYWDKTRQERLVASSDVDWTIVRPAVLTNGKSRGIRKHGKGVGGYFWTARIPRADVAQFMLQQLESNAYSHTAVGIE
jgi:uncharacterized protein YbjT (DUF2867 family)